MLGVQKTYPPGVDKILKVVGCCKSESTEKTDKHTQTHNKAFLASFLEGINSNNAYSFSFAPNRFTAYNLDFVLFFLFLHDKAKANPCWLMVCFQVPEINATDQFLLTGLYTGHSSSVWAYVGFLRMSPALKSVMQCGQVKAMVRMT